MKPQFSTSSMLWATAFVGVAITGFGPLWHRYDYDFDVDLDTVLALSWLGIIAAPMYLPVVFVAYAIGRKAMTWRIALAFAAMEVAAYLANRYWGIVTDRLM